MVTAETEGCAGEGLSCTVVAEDLATSVPLMRALTARLATAAALPVAGNRDGETRKLQLAAPLLVAAIALVLQVPRSTCKSNTCSSDFWGGTRAVNAWQKCTLVCNSMCIEYE